MEDGKSEDVPPGRAFTCGIIMGGADAIPGVSASTMALILGIYSNFIESLYQIVNWFKIKFNLKKLTERNSNSIKSSLKVLIPIAFGMLIGIFLISRLLIGPDENPGIMRKTETGAIAYSFVFGLVLSSASTPIQRIEKTTKKHWILGVISALLLASFTMIGVNEAEPPLWTLPLAGAIAATAMLIPGISGSLVLLILGHYAIISSALNDFEFVKLFIFSIGLLIGAIISIPIIHRILATHHDSLMAILSGLILGSLPTLWPWKNQYNIESGKVQNIAPTNQFMGVTVAFIIGFTIIILLQQLEKKRKQNHSV